MADSPPLLNVYDAEIERGPVSLICFLDPVLAGARGIDGRAVVGEYVKDANGEFDLDAFRVNPGFVESLTGYMNEEAAGSDEVVEQARAFADGLLYIIDPRDQTASPEEPPASNVIGAFAVDEAGNVVPGSFRYNAKHALFEAVEGMSAVLYDRRFYEWLHRIR
jgi:hypothetical protein